jgi:hypothetical protein
MPNDCYHRIVMLLVTISALIVLMIMGGCSILPELYISDETYYEMKRDARHYNSYRHPRVYHYNSYRHPKVHRHHHYIHR